MISQFSARVSVTTSQVSNSCSLFTGVPHFMQNFISSFNAAPQLAHVFSGFVSSVFKTSGSFVPHFAQKTLPLGISAPHFSHTAIPFISWICFFKSFIFSSDLFTSSSKASISVFIPVIFSFMKISPIFKPLFLIRRVSFAIIELSLDISAISFVFSAVLFVTSEILFPKSSKKPIITSLKFIKKS